MGLVNCCNNSEIEDSISENNKVNTYNINFIILIRKAIYR